MQIGLRIEPTNKELTELAAILHQATIAAARTPSLQIAPAASASASSRALTLLQQLLGVLDEHIALARTNLALASQRGPMHGVLLALR